MSLVTLPSIPFQDTLQDVTRRIVETAHPKRIVLFGSAARGTMTRDSDLDMLVIMHGSVHRRQMAQKILRQLHGVGLPVDIVVVTEEDVRKSEQGGFSIIQPALQDGKVVYDDA
jgi:predicted nucleotidyltransferase